MSSEGNNLLHEVDGEGKCKKEKKCSDDGMSKNGEEKKIKAERKNKKKKKAPQEPPIGGYVHVRARRGQATDSHSLAERVRREKISERMRLLQSLVPGCDKMTGKALILEEIINYVQCLQNQVQFLVMKLADAYPMFNYLDTNTPASEVLLGIGEIIASRSCPKVLLLNGIHDRETSGFSAACFVTAIADALNRTYGDPHNCLKNHPSQYINTLLVPKDGQIPVVAESLAAQGIFHVITVDSVRDPNVGVVFEPKSLIQALGDLLSGYTSTNAIPV